MCKRASQQLRRSRSRSSLWAIYQILGKLEPSSRGESRSRCWAPQQILVKLKASSWGDPRSSYCAPGQIVGNPEASSRAGPGPVTEVTKILGKPEARRWGGPGPVTGVQIILGKLKERRWGGRGPVTEVEKILGEQLELDVFWSVFQSRFGLVSSVLAVGSIHFALIMCYLLLSGPSVTMFEMGPLQSNFRRPFKNSNRWFSWDSSFFQNCCPLSSPLLQIKMEKTYHLQDHSANPEYICNVLWSNLQPHAGSNNLLHLFSAECPKDPTYSWWLQRPLVNSLGYHILLLIARREYINDPWLKKACSSLNVRLSQSCCWDFTLDVTQGHPLRLEVNFLLELWVTNVMKQQSLTICSCSM